jgi:hypothetical protein
VTIGERIMAGLLLGLEAGWRDIEESARNLAAPGPPS